MRKQIESRFEVCSPPKQAELELVVPFTTPQLTRAALDAAGRMGAGLNSTVRLIRVQVISFPLEIDQSPVFIDFMEEQLRHLQCALPMKAEIRLARDFDHGLVSALNIESVIDLAAPRRPWRTRNERLAASLRRAGYKVVLVAKEKEFTERNGNA
jgi:hypothetical protein